MIDIKKILTRSWHILWNYRTLWVFGILLALTAGGGGSSGGGSSGTGYQFDSRDLNTNGNDSNLLPDQMIQQAIGWFQQNISPLLEHPDRSVMTLIWIGIALLLVLLIMGVIAAFVRYVSETAVMRMVDEYEQTGAIAGFRQGWRLGWDRRAFRLWVIDLILFLPVFLFIALLIGAGIFIFFSLTGGQPALAIGGVILASGLGFVLLLAIILLIILLSLLRQFFARFAALEGCGISESLRRGWEMFKLNWKSAGLMWLVMLGIGFAYGIAGILLFILLIPVLLILLLPAALAGAIPGAIALGIASIFVPGVPAWILALIIAFPFFLTVLFSPLILVGGWYAIYRSSVWTLTYREIKALGAGQQKQNMLEEGLKPEIIHPM